ncbi:MAG: YitT family protein [Sphingomonadales bacterium]|nr:YitT family protein [Sphingomonadales bacterium]
MWQRVQDIVNSLFWTRAQHQVFENMLTRYRRAKRFRAQKIVAQNLLRDIFFILLGIVSASFGLKGLLLPNHFIDGGATGISLLLTTLSATPLWILIPLVNIPFIVMGYRIMGSTFAIKTALAIAGLALCLAYIDFPLVTQDKILVAVFGGFFLGAGIGLAVRGGTVIDGTEVLAIYLSRKLGTTIGDIILVINIIIFSLAAYLLNIEVALYSIITYMVASKMLDFIVEGIEEYIGVTIVSSHSEEIREMIINVMGRGVTVYQGKGGYGKRGEKRNLDILYTVITRLEINKLNTEIEKITPTAFVVMNPVKETKGGQIKKRPLKH